MMPKRIASFQDKDHLTEAMTLLDGSEEIKRVKLYPVADAGSSGSSLAAKGQEAKKYLDLLCHEFVFVETARWSSPTHILVVFPLNQVHRVFSLSTDM